MNPDPTILKKLDDLIEANLDNPDFAINAVCQKLGVSRSQLHRMLIEETQLSTTLYIRKKRLEKAKILLSTTNLRISEITDAVGINSHANFSKYFIEEFNISPRDFKKRVEEQKNSVQKPKNEAEHLPEPARVQEPPAAFASNPVDISAASTPDFSKIYALVALFAVIGIGYYFMAHSQILKSNSELTAIPENSVAILPFKNLGEAQKSYFSEGVMEQIHSSLATFNELKIISTTSSNKYANTPKTIPQIAQELRVNYLLNGTVLQIDNQVRITVELVRAKDDRVVWTKKFEGDTKNIFSYMNTVSKEVAVELNQKLTQKLDKTPTQSLPAYNQYLQGRQLLQTRTKEKMEAGITKFDKAIELDASFSDAYADKAIAYFLMGDDQFMEVETAYKMAEKNALTAIRLDAENGRAYAVLGLIYKVQNKWEQAMTTLHIALKFSPNDALITYWYSLTLRSIGQMEEAIKYSTKAVSLDPLSSTIYSGHIIGCAYAGQLATAEKAIEDGQLVFNETHLFHNAKAFYYLKRQEYEAALTEFLQCDQLSARVYYKTLIAYTKAKLGQQSEAELYLKSLPPIPDNYKYFATVYAGLGDRDNCLKYLQLAAEKSDSPNYLKVSPLFVFLHNDARFNAILQKLGLLNPAFSTP
ncbi:helix-turn-helix domain-containing protein [Runella sp. CRIBMP]|uniref:FlgO family outer membrane protein n=1 Tax=Runella sp. CRIBMP TaxID=2683261 RepID=UPI001412EB19|nr:FlgO family outer membrane protein [Runella sp. CRIBMP]NBB18412.1 helix-turn-helix domain-containing protein [Runella sp. CRIBMP]